MNNHSTSECRNLSTAQDAVSQAKNRNRNDNSHQGNQANFGNHPVWKPAQPSSSQ
jgi:hypothetical protein